MNSYPVNFRKYATHLAIEWIASSGYIIAVDEIISIRQEKKGASDICEVCKKSHDWCHIDLMVVKNNEIKFYVDDDLTFSIVVYPRKIKVKSLNQLKDETRKKDNCFLSFLKYDEKTFECLNEFLQSTRRETSLTECRDRLVAFLIDPQRDLFEVRPTFFERMANHRSEFWKRAERLERLKKADDLLQDCPSEDLKSQIEKMKTEADRTFKTYAYRIQDGLQLRFGVLPEDLPFLDIRKPDGFFTKEFFQTERRSSNKHFRPTAEKEDVEDAYTYSVRKMIRWFAKLGSARTLPLPLPLRHSNYVATKIVSFLKRKGFDYVMGINDAGERVSLTVKLR